MNPVTTSISTVSNSFVPSAPHGKNGSALAKGSKSGQETKLHKRQFKTAKPLKAIAPKSTKPIVDGPASNGGPQPSQQKATAQRMPTKAMLAFMDDLDNELSADIERSDAQIATQTKTHTTYPDPAVRLKELFVEFARLDWGYEKLAQPSSVAVDLSPSEQSGDAIKKAEKEQLNAELDALANAIDNPDISKQPVADVAVLPSTANLPSSGRPLTALVASKEFSLNPAFKRRTARSAKEGKAKKLVDDKKSWNLKPSQQDRAAPKNQKVGLKKHVKQSAQPTTKSAVKTGAITIKAKKFVDMEQGHRNLFMNPVHPDTWVALKESAAMTKLFRFEPKWFQKGKKDLETSIQSFERIMKPVDGQYLDRTYSRAAEDIVSELKSIYNQIKMRRPVDDKGVLMLKNDIALLEAIFKQYQ